MKGIYLVYGSMDNFLGIKKKVIAQVAAFNKSNLNCSLYVSESKLGRLGKVIRRLPYLNSFENWIKNITINDLDYLYIRKPIIDYQFISDLKNIKEIKSNIKIFLEVPTYPYDQELNRIIDLPLLIKEKQNRKKIKNLVDKIITYSDDEEILGVETIKIRNGIDVRAIKLRKSVTHSEDLNLVGVANVAKWHGYDRLIKGIADYYKSNSSRKVFFHLVGNGEELVNLKNITKELDVVDYIVFHGTKSGMDLDNIFNLCQIGIGSLANHRKGLTKDSALKNREYCAKGLPFIIASQDDDFPSEFKYVYRVSQNEESINIESIIKFYESIKQRNFLSKMREYAEENLTWEVKMEPVIKVIKE